MASLRKRIEQGDFSEETLALWDNHSMSVPLCCHEVIYQDGKPVAYRCDMTDFLSPSSFYKVCMDCQDIIEMLIKTHRVNKQ